MDFHTHTVLPVLVALLVGVLLLPALNIVRVDARGMGHEHSLPWRARTSFVVAAGLAGVHGLLRRLRQMRAHPLFKPVLACGVVLAILLFKAHALLAAPLALGAALTEGQHQDEFLLEERMSAGRPSRENITVLSGQNLKAGAVIGRVRVGIGRISIPAVVGTGSGTVSNVFAGPEVELGSYLLKCTAAVTNGGVFSLVTPSGKALPSLTMTPGSGGTTIYRSRHINFTITDATDFIVNDQFTFVVDTTAPTVIGGTGTDTISALSLGADAKPGNYRVICTAAVSNGGVWQVYRGGPNGGDSIGIFTMTPGSGGASAFETRHINFTLTDATDVIVGNYFDVCVFNTLTGGKVVAFDPTNFDGRHRADGVLSDNVDATGGDTAGVIIARDAAVRRDDLQYGAAITSSQQASAENDLLAHGIVVR